MKSRQNKNDIINLSFGYAIIESTFNQSYLLPCMFVMFNFFDINICAIDYTLSEKDSIDTD